MTASCWTLSRRKIRQNKRHSAKKPASRKTCRFIYYLAPHIPCRGGAMPRPHLHIACGNAILCPKSPGGAQPLPYNGYANSSSFRVIARRAKPDVAISRYNVLLPPPPFGGTPLVNAGGKASLVSHSHVGAGQCPAHKLMRFTDCLRQCDFVPKIAGRGSAPPLQWVKKHGKGRSLCRVWFIAGKAYYYRS